MEDIKSLRLIPGYKPSLWLSYAAEGEKEHAAIFKGELSVLTKATSAYAQRVTNWNVALPPSEYSFHNLNEAAKAAVKSRRDVVIDYYEHPPIRLKRYIRHLRLKHKQEVCPYCGHRVKPDTLDHFIPKKEWAEYSILPENLVPQCSTCASIKGTKYAVVNGSACRYIHPYFFDYLSRVKFRVSIDFTGQRLPVFNINFVVPKALSVEIKGRIRTHLDELQVEHRLKIWCYETFVTWRDKLKHNYFDITSSLQARVNENIQRQEYDWETSLYVAILKNPSLIDYLHSYRPGGEGRINTDADTEETL